MTKRYRTEIKFKNKEEMQTFEKIREQLNFNSLPKMFKDTLKTFNKDIPKVDNDELKKLIKEVNRIGVNLNQMATKFNLYQLDEAKKLELKLDQIRVEFNMVKDFAQNALTK